MAPRDPCHTPDQDKKIPLGAAMKKAARPVPVESQPSLTEDVHQAKKPRIETKKVPAEESNFYEHPALDALQVVALLKEARETEQIKDAIRTCVRMAQSAMRYLLVENLSDSQVHGEPKKLQSRKKSNNSKESEHKSQTLREIRDELQTACQSSPFHFADRENMMEVLWTSLDILKQRLQHLPSANNSTSKFNFKPFWTDIKRFLKHKGTENDQSRILVCGLEGLYGTSPMNIANLKSITEKIILITVHSSSIRSTDLLKSLKDFAQTIIKSCQDPDNTSATEAQELLKLLVRRLLHQFHSWHAVVKSVTQLNMAREALPVLAEILHQAQLVNPEIIYNECYHEINKLTELLCSKDRQTTLKPSKSSHSTKNGKNSKDAQPNTPNKVSWPCLFSCFTWIKVLSTEEAIDPKYSLTPVKDVLATILLTIARNHLQESNKSPIVLKAFSLLNLLAEATQRFVPMGIMLLQFGYRLAADLEAQVHIAPGAKLGQVQSVSNILKIRSEDFSVRLKEDLFFEYLRITLDFLKLMAHHPAFPETSHLILMHLKKISKTVKQTNLRGHCKAICEAGDKSQRKVEVLRNKLNINELPSSLFIISPSDFATLDIASLKYKAYSQEERRPKTLGTGRFFMSVVVDDTYFSQSVDFKSVIGHSLTLYLRGAVSDTQVKKFKLVLEDDSCEPLVSNRIRDFLDQSNFEAFSIVVQEAETGVLCAARDKWGRCGLIYGSNSETSELIVGHVPTGAGFHDWTEIGIEGVYTIYKGEVKISPWQNQLLIHDIDLDRSGMGVSIDGLTEVLRTGARTQWNWKESGTPQKITILFSGGLDSTILAGLAAMEGVPEIDLISVSFDSGRSPDRLTTLLSFINLALIWKDVRWRLLLRDIATAEAEEVPKTISVLLQPNKAVMDMTIGSALYFAAEMKGWVISDIVTAGNLLMNDWEEKVSHCSQGELLRELDRVADEAENVVCINEGIKETKDKENDAQAQQCSKCTYIRKPGCVNHCCKFCCIKVAKVAASEDRSVCCRVHQIGDEVKKEEAAFEQMRIELQKRWDSWLASGEAILGQSDAKVILCGNAADELFGGYGRYKTREMHGGLEGWRKEMMMDLQRLWTRNLGRDDRSTLTVLKDGAMICHPFLSSCVGFARESYDTKILLRQVAYALGLTVTAKLRKRAIQFGSRAARSRITSGGKSRRKVKGSDSIFGEG